MDVLADTGYIYALVQPRDRLHQAALDYYLNTSDRILLPAPVLTEFSLLAHRAGGNTAVVAGGRAVRQSRAALTDPLAEDYDRAIAILEKYADSRIDFVDATIMAMAERLKLTRILTFDHRDFSLYRPSHTKQFELLP